MAKKVLGVLLIVLGGPMFLMSLKNLVNLDMDKPSGSGALILSLFCGAMTFGGISLVRSNKPRA